MRATATLDVNISTPSEIRAGCGAIKDLPQIVRQVAALHAPATSNLSAFLLTDGGVSDAGIADRVAKTLTDAGISSRIYRDIPANPSSVALDRAAEAIRGEGATVLVAIGGGSVLDSAKGAGLLARNFGTALEFCQSPASRAPSLPIIAIPTTAGTGAETNGFGVIEDPAIKAKFYISDESAIPKVAILDPEFTVGVPSVVTAATGFDALIHGIESLTSIGANPVSMAYAGQAVQLVSQALPKAVADGSNLEARSQMLWGAHLAGRALSISGLGIVHGLGHAITALTGAPHGIALASVAEVVLADQERRHPELYAYVDSSFSAANGVANGVSVAADILTAEAAVANGVNPGMNQISGSARVAARVGALVEAIGIRHSFSELAVTAQMIPEIVDKALRDPVTSNTATIPSRAELISLLERLG